jgi:hypothetical protein
MACFGPQNAVLLVLVLRGKAVYILEEVKARLNVWRLTIRSGIPGQRFTKFANKIIGVFSESKWAFISLFLTEPGAIVACPLSWRLSVMDNGRIEIPSFANFGYQSRGAQLDHRTLPLHYSPKSADLPKEKKWVQTTLKFQKYK